ncbi:MAG: helix-turn-helix domain-containing protein [Cetobacterium sp.]|uniref:helix-turn-helix domain-containing protein n=1 Tax=Cetobacterium sp. TaxID=2071632 RepID=UPI003EE73658
MKSILVTIRMKALEKGKTMTEIAEHFNISRDTLYRKIKNNDIDFIVQITKYLDSIKKL